ncbi:MAG TPA: SDR family oxidoreductase [Actinomycetota bacterium]|nr:SDR family oxidoreductase [Actinomycetota bacterium]
MALLDGKVAIVTGAGRGIGRGEALLLAQHGAKVVVNDLGGEWDGSGADRRPAQLVVDEITGAGGEALANYDDVADFTGAESLIRQSIDTWGTLDILVNNAGILRDRMIFNMSEEDWDSVIRVHLKGHFAPTRHACAYWRERSKQSGGPVGGRIICTSSTSGLLGNAGQSNYGAAKAGIAAFAQIVSMEMGRYGVTANAIAPAARTRLTEATFGEIKTVGEFDSWAPENVAPIVVFLATDAAAEISGQVFYTGGGTLQLYDGWGPVEQLSKDDRFTVEELVERVPGMFGGKPHVYAPPKSLLRTDVTG